MGRPWNPGPCPDCGGKKHKQARRCQDCYAEAKVGTRATPETRAKLAAQRGDWGRLLPRMIELRAAGKSFAVIAADIGADPYTVRRHLTLAGHHTPTARKPWGGLASMRIRPDEVHQA